MASQIRQKKRAADAIIASTAYIDYHNQLGLRLGQADPRNRKLFLKLLVAGPGLTECWCCGDLLSTLSNSFFSFYSGKLSLEHGDAGNSQGG